MSESEWDTRTPLWQDWDYNKGHTPYLHQHGEGTRYALHQGVMTTSSKIPAMALPKDRRPPFRKPFHPTRNGAKKKREGYLRFWCQPITTAFSRRTLTGSGILRCQSTSPE
ncbi:hypothetical protein JMJ35_008404 [Cladonia borealis]|uniref:Uncharacterized protein n=1 Tax=Cladonia borealis TaxID=184061 RepID=A0AA39QWJ1_9LECA|nr:hypothetical protein JMJ35_008404 [Cladonia borealis]